MHMTEHTRVHKYTHTHTHTHTHKEMVGKQKEQDRKGLRRTDAEAPILWPPNAKN